MCGLGLHLRPSPTLPLPVLRIHPTGGRVGAAQVRLGRGHDVRPSPQDCSPRRGEEATAALSQCQRKWKTHGEETKHKLEGKNNGSDGKESACNVGDLGLIPGWGGSPGEGIGNPLQDSCLENPMDRGAWGATVTTEAANTFTSKKKGWGKLKIISPSTMCPWGPMFSREVWPLHSMPHG